MILITVSTNRLINLGGPPILRSPGIFDNCPIRAETTGDCLSTAPEPSEDVNAMVARVRLLVASYFNLQNDTNIANETLSEDI